MRPRSTRVAWRPVPRTLAVGLVVVLVLASPFVVLGQRAGTPSSSSSVGEYLSRQKSQVGVVRSVENSSPSSYSGDDIVIEAFNASSYSSANLTCGSYTKDIERVYIRSDGLINEESGLASSFKNRGVLWVHNDNYDKKRVYALSSATGRLLATLDLEHLPGINEYSDFEDIAVAHCPKSEDWCVWVGDTGNNAEWGKGTFIYVVHEPKLSLDAVEAKTIVPESSLTLRINYDTHEYFSGPNVEALTVSKDGTKVWAIQKTFRNEGDGPAGIWESDPLVLHPQDECVLGSNNTWQCALCDRPGYFVSHPHQGAKLVNSPNFDKFIRSDSQEGGQHVVVPLMLRRVAEIANPIPSQFESVRERLKDIRNIASADISLDGQRLVIATYGGIFEYRLAIPHDFTTLAFHREVTTTNRDGTPMTSDGKFWKGQEGICWDYTDPNSDQYGMGIWSVSEHHKKFFHLKCND